jgi:hypothetical protein
MASTEFGEVLLLSRAECGAIVCVFFGFESHSQLVLELSEEAKHGTAVVMVDLSLLRQKRGEAN